MKNTITLQDTLPDSPSTITFGSDGSFLTSSGEPGIGKFVDPRFSTEPSVCPHTQATKDKPYACSHRQVCCQTISKWHVRRGQYQRPDVTVYDRLDIAQRYYAPNRPWGRVVRMAQEYDLSRRTICDIAEQGALLFEPRLPGPVPCLKQMLPCGHKLSLPKAETNILSRQEEKNRGSRLILTAIFPGGATMRPMEDILAETPFEDRSASTICRFINEEGKKARHILSQVDYTDVSMPKVLVDVDETFFDGHPISFVVEPQSLTICGFYVPSDDDRSSASW